MEIFVCRCRRANCNADENLPCGRAARHITWQQRTSRWGATTHEQGPALRRIEKVTNSAPAKPIPCLCVPDQVETREDHDV